MSGPALAERSFDYTLVRAETTADGTVLSQLSGATVSQSWPAPLAALLLDDGNSLDTLLCQAGLQDAASVATAAAASAALSTSACQTLAQLLRAVEEAALTH